MCGKPATTLCKQPHGHRRRHHQWVADSGPASDRLGAYEGRATSISSGPASRGGRSCGCFADGLRRMRPSRW